MSGWQQQQTDPETHACAASRAGSMEEGENGEREPNARCRTFFLIVFIYWCEPMSEVLPSMVFLSLSLVSQVLLAWFDFRETIMPTQVRTELPRCNKLRRMSFMCYVFLLPSLPLPFRRHQKKKKKITSYSEYVPDSSLNTHGLRTTVQEHPEAPAAVAATVRGLVSLSCCNV